MAAASKREQIINKALELFYQHGFNFTGVDKIIKEAGVSKKTLYNHFKSKDELILATLRQRDQMFRNKLMRAIERRADGGQARLLAVFDALDEWFHEKDFSGCMFINASAEFSDPESPCRLLSAEHKRLQKTYLQQLAVAAGAKAPAQLAQQLNLLIEGAISTAHVERDLEAAIKAKAMAEVFIHKALS